MNVFITGGAGYIGTALCDALDALPEIDQITVFDALTRGDRRFFLRAQPYRKVRFVHGNVLDGRQVAEASRGHDVVVHLAAFVDEPYHHSQHVQYEQVNGFGTLSVVRALEASPDLKRAIYLSSTAVYGFRANLNAESDPGPENGYGVSKLLGEHYFAQLRHADKEVHVLRSGQVFGPNRSMRFDTVVHAFFFEALTNGRIAVHGDGKQSRAFAALPDVVDALVARVMGAEAPALLASFQATIQELLHWMTGQIPSMEYRYLSPNIALPSQTFQRLPGLNPTALQSAWDDFIQSSAIR